MKTILLLDANLIWNNRAEVISRKFWYILLLFILQMYDTKCCISIISKLSDTKRDDYKAIA